MKRKLFTLVKKLFLVIFVNNIVFFTRPLCNDFIKGKSCKKPGVNTGFFPLSKSDIQDPVSEIIKDQKLLLSSWFLTGAFESVFEKTS